jgi:hypothetical protein
VVTVPRNLINDADRERVRALHAEGMSRNDIACEIGRSPSTVTGTTRARAALPFFPRGDTGEDLDRDALLEQLVEHDQVGGPRNGGFGVARMLSG